MISQLASGQKIIKLGDTSPTRDFNYVSDTCRGFVALAESDKTLGQVVNIGSNYEISIGDTFSLIKKIMKVDAEFEVDKDRIRPDKSEVHRLWCDNSLIKQLTSYQPQVNIEQGLTNTIEWFLNPENLKKYKAHIYNV